MTPALPPVLPQSSAPHTRALAGAVAVDPQKAPRPARDAETARAPRPVDAAGAPADLRLTTRRDPPLGPPPAFAINVLDHLRDTALDPLPRDLPDGETATVRAIHPSEPRAAPRVDLKL